MSTRLTIAPRAAFRCGAAAWARKNGARALEANSSSHCCGVASPMRRRLERRGVVDQRIEAAEAADGLRHQFGQAVELGKIRLQGQHAARRAPTPVRPASACMSVAERAVMQGQVVALGVQAARDGRADAAGAAGDQGDGRGCGMELHGLQGVSPLCPDRHAKRECLTPFTVPGMLRRITCQDARSAAGQRKRSGWTGRSTEPPPSTS